MAPGIPADGEVALEVGHIDDFKIRWLKGSEVDFAIIDRNLVETRSWRAGFKGLRVGENVVLGRDLDPDRFDFPDKVSRRHLQIGRRKDGQEDIILMTDLGSSNGTLVIVRGPQP